MKSFRKNSPGVLILAHGSPESQVEAEAITLCRKLTHADPKCRLFALAWLNRKPGLADALESLVLKGCSRVHVMPLLIFQGKHLQHDVPALLCDARRRYPAIKLTLGRHLAGIPGFALWLAQKSRFEIKSRRQP